VTRSDGDGWEKLRDDVAATLANLADGEFLILGPPAQAVGRRRWRRITAPIAPYVQFSRFETTLLGECSGATSFGGPVDLTPDQDAAIRALGWQHPDDVPTWGPQGVRNYRCRWPSVPPGGPAPAAYPDRDVTRLAAALAVDTLRGPLAVASPEELILEQGR